MSQNTPNTTLIVGSGLAGICIAYEMYKKQIPFQIIDSGINVSTDIAAGIINPIVFRRVTTSWRVAEFIPEALKFYEELTAAWGNTYFKEIPIRRAFSHQQEVDLWLKKQELPEFTPYLKPLDDADEKCNKVINTFGTGKVYQSGYVEASLLLQDALKWLESENYLRKETFIHTNLDPETGEYQGEKFKDIIFCEGYQGVYNPWFSYLPLETTKGEVLTIEAKGLTEEESVNRKCFVMPIGNHRFKVGATYEWNTANTEITEEGKNTICENFKSLTNEDFTILSQKAGIRPTTLDRRPLIGSHHTYKKLKIFNGLGAKGFLIAPLLAKEFITSIENNFSIDKEVNVERYNRLLNKN